MTTTGHGAAAAAHGSVAALGGVVDEGAVGTTAAGEVHASHLVDEGVGVLADWVLVLVDPADREEVRGLGLKVAIGFGGAGASLAHAGLGPRGNPRSCQDKVTAMVDLVLRGRGAVHFGGGVVTVDVVRRQLLHAVGAGEGESGRTAGTSRATGSSRSSLATTASDGQRGAEGGRTHGNVILAGIKGVHGRRLVGLRAGGFLGENAGVGLLEGCEGHLELGGLDNGLDPDGAADLKLLLESLKRRWSEGLASW
jgi:hypothetical protein